MVSFVLGGLVLGGLLPAGCAPEEEAIDGPEPDTAYRADRRVAALLEPCPRSGYYDRFVDDMVPVLIEKLSTVGGDPLKRAKEELAALGDRAAESLRRELDENFTDPERSPVLENVLDAIALSESELCHDVLVRALGHPMESVRQRAMIGMLGHHARPEDFMLFRGRIGAAESLPMERLYLQGLFVADRPRAEALCLAWFESDTNPQLWTDAAQELAESREPATGAACVPHLGELDARFATWLAAPAARFEHEAGVRYLHERLQEPDPNQRIIAVRALTAAGRVDDLSEPLAEDPSEAVRILCIDGIAGAEEVTEERREWLSAALSDGSSAVRAAALVALCRLGDDAAQDLALSFLLEEPALLQSALQALHGPMRDDPDLAERAFAALMERYELESFRPLEQRGATFKAIGVVPLPEAAAFLRRVALETEGEVIESLRAHEWIMIQASNTGPDGRGRLWEELENESDPIRRLDLIDAVTSVRDDAGTPRDRENVLRLAERSATAPLERLYAAYGAIKLGPSTQVAPRLRLVVSSMGDAKAQVALQCLLWRWY